MSGHVTSSDHTEWCTATRYLTGTSVPGKVAPRSFRSSTRPLSARRSIGHVRWVERDFDPLAVVVDLA